MVATEEAPAVHDTVGAVAVAAMAVAGATVVAEAEAVATAVAEVAESTEVGRSVNHNTLES